MVTVISTAAHRHAAHRQGQLPPVPQLVPSGWPRLLRLRQGSGRGQCRSVERAGASVNWDIRDLNRWADEGDAETITKKINDGKNGLAARFDRLARISLVLLGYRADNVLQFQADHCLRVDGDVGPKTRAVLHTARVLDRATANSARLPLRRCRFGVQEPC
ncbi:chitinase [Sinorhizobium meliloti]|nr:chitinase [Sinorhizobium meliloti]